MNLYESHSSQIGDEVQSLTTVDKTTGIFWITDLNEIDETFKNSKGNSHIRDLYLCFSGEKIVSDKIAL